MFGRRFLVSDPVTPLAYFRQAKHRWNAITQYGKIGDLTILQQRAKSMLPGLEIEVTHRTPRYTAADNLINLWKENNTLLFFSHELTHACQNPPSSWLYRLGQQFLVDMGTVFRTPYAHARRIHDQFNTLITGSSPITPAGLQHLLKSERPNLKSLQHLKHRILKEIQAYRFCLKHEQQNQEGVSLYASIAASHLEKHKRLMTAIRIYQKTLPSIADSIISRGDVG